MVLQVKGGCLLEKENAMKLIRFAIVMIVGIGGLYLSYVLFGLLYPFVIALVVAMMINPVVRLIENKLKFSRGISVFIALLMLLIIATLIPVLLVVEVIAGVEYLIRIVPANLDFLVVKMEEIFTGQLMPMYNQIMGMFEGLNASKQSTITSQIQSMGSAFTESASNFFKNIMQSLLDFIKWLPNLATALIFAILGTFFISKDWNKLKSIGLKIVPQRVRISGSSIFSDLKKALVGFLKAQIILISITMVTVVIGLLIMRIEHGVTIGILIGLVDLLPYLGTGLIFVPWIIYSFVAGHVGIGIGLSILYAIIVIQRQLLEPKVLSSTIGLDPLATLVALFVGFKLLGFLGLIVGPVTLVIINTLISANVFKDLWIYIKGNK